jgi:hypothetical protein
LFLSLFINPSIRYNYDSILKKHHLLKIGE